MELGLVSDVVSGVAAEELTILHPSVDRDHCEADSTEALHVEER